MSSVHEEHKNMARYCCSNPKYVGIVFAFLCSAIMRESLLSGVLVCRGNECGRGSRGTVREEETWIERMEGKGEAKEQGFLTAIEPSVNAKERKGLSQETNREAGIQRL